MTYLPSNSNSTRFSYSIIRFQSQSQPYVLPSTPIPSYRAFSSSPLLLKKKGKADREAESSSPSTAETEDPFDFSSLNFGIEKVLKKLDTDLGKLRTGGRFNPEILENVRVHLVKDSKGTERLGDLAQVLPKGGRSVMVLVGEKEVSFSSSIDWLRSKRRG